MTALATTMTVAFGTAGHAQSANTLTVKKVVVGTPAIGTEFTVKVECDSSGDTTLTFGANGDPDPSGSNVLNVDATDTCTVSETASGGASSVAYACDEGDNSVGTECSADNKTVEYTDTDGQDATITITNTFVAPTTTTTTPPATTTTPASPPASTNVVTVQPTFTG